MSIILYGWLGNDLFAFKRNNKSSLRWVYLMKFFPGHFHNSTFTSELIYSASNLVVLFNDLLMCSGRCTNSKFPQFESKIKIWLTIVEYTETLLEISAKRLGGQTGKWFIITVIQIFK